MTVSQIIAIVVFSGTIILVISEKIHRAAAALTGAVLLIISGILSVEECVSYIDANTVGVLIGMMLFVAVVKNSGLFEYIAVKAAKMTGGRPWSIMLVFVLITAVLSAFLDNVTTVLLIGPMTLAVTGILELNPVPFLMAEILASNAGGAATLIGDPPNIMIGSAAGLTFADFLANTGVAVLPVMFAMCLSFYFMYGRKLHVEQDKMRQVQLLNENEKIKDGKLLAKSLVVLACVVAAFMVHDKLGLETCVIALSAAAVMMLIGGQNIEEIVEDVEWPTILFFCGLFIVVGGLEKTGLIDNLAGIILDISDGKMLVTLILILWVSAIVSAFLDNIPFVATMIPLIMSLESQGMDVSSLWWALALGACLGGNGTLIGASANVVLSGISSRHGYPITFASFFKVGFPQMLISIAISTIIVLIRYA